MFNEKRIESIRNNIQISTILSDHEKSDWLNLLDLMNDKQLGELEEILGAAPVAANMVTQSPSQPNGTNISNTQMPPLSHIANVPTDVTMVHSVPKTVPAPVVPTMPTRKPISASTIPSSLQSQPKDLKSVNTFSAATIPAHKSVNSSKAPAGLSSPPVSSLGLQKLTIQNIGEIQQYDVSVLRKHELQSVVDAFRLIIQNNGYFQVLQQLEASQLYRSYIETGKFMLGHGTAQVTDPETTLTQTEFEFITDLLRHMRFNTW